ncbi:MAG: alanine--tRNA ligase [Candidatus Schekmanbacteria bacterium]|nr:MAG: alanine--tRNA ligase [Candidatus Schekmanbacteria bacterium]
MLSGHDIRKIFLDYFAEKEHKILPGSSLVPSQDPTLLFTNAGMVQFKSIFLGEETREYKRAATVQKCVRAGGKHNDLEVVGKTRRHHTFFEMLGNFSFGDYFKEKAIEYGWDFLTNVIKLPKEKLWITIYEEDDESLNIWVKQIGIAEDKVVRMGKKDNFWQMGDTGPCGPCSEILIDQGEEAGCGKSTCAVGCDCDRYLELWNLVFMQFNRSSDGNLSPLPKPSIDTGMGLERITAVVQKVKSNFDTDLFSPLIDEVGRITGYKYGSNETNDVSVRVIVDHARAATFLISDGVLPSNEGRGYVLRRILRRGLRHGKMLGIKDPFFGTMCEKVIENMSSAYPELLDSSKAVKGVVKNEEDKFAATLEQGLQILHQKVEEIRREDKDAKIFPGEFAFKLYDTYGFPVDLTSEILQDFQLEPDLQGFSECMKKQRLAAKKSHMEKSISSQEETLRNLLQGIESTEFLGYESESTNAEVIKIIKDAKECKYASEGDKVSVILDKTVFYGESGGQIGDKGKISSNGNLLNITDATKPFGNIIIHHGIIEKGRIKEGDRVFCEIAKERRLNIKYNHTATHILHSALKQVLGAHVNQAGSLVAPDRLRFDFTHFSKMTEEEINEVEDIVNEVIRMNLPVATNIMKLEDAIKSGATALFDEKYSEKVRVVAIENFSKELCGGTHCKRTGEIGYFKIISERAVASGVRRIEACTGSEAVKLSRETEKKFEEIASLLKTGKDNIREKIKNLLEENRNLSKRIESLEASLSKKEITKLKDTVKRVSGINLLSVKTQAPSIKELRNFADDALKSIGEGIAVVGAVIEGKVSIVCAVSKTLTNRISASDIVKEISPIIKGSGGGRKDFAQAGGKNPNGLEEALSKVEQIVQKSALAE